MGILQIICGIFNRDNKINASFIIQDITSRIIQPASRGLNNTTVSILTKLGDWINGKTLRINPPQRIRRLLIKVPPAIQPNRILKNKPHYLRVAAVTFNLIGKTSRKIINISRRFVRITKIQLLNVSKQPFLEILYKIISIRLNILP